MFTPKKYKPYIPIYGNNYTESMWDNWEILF